MYKYFVPAVIFGLLASTGCWLATANADDGAAALPVEPVAPVESGAQGSQSVPPPQSESSSASTPALITLPPADATQESLKKLAVIPEPDSAITGSLPPDDEAKVTQAYEAVLRDCARDIDTNEAVGRSRAKWSVGLALLGALSGGIIAPALITGGAATVLSTSFSGLSGIMNTAQESLTDADLSAKTARQNAADLRAKLAGPIERYSKAFGNTSASAATRLAEMKVAILQIRSECLLAK